MGLAERRNRYDRSLYYIRISWVRKNNAYKGKKIAVIENDFGEARIDASLLEKYDLKVNSLTEGCICCSLAGDLKKQWKCYCPVMLQKCC